MFGQDLETLGLGHQRHYESRSTFINLAEAGGAPEEVVARITHPGIKAAKDLYSRVGQRWPGMCAAVRCIRLPPPDGAGNIHTDGPGNILAADPSGLACSSSESGYLGETWQDGRARESNPPAAPFSTTHRF
jgi:hypothetical protein